MNIKKTCFQLISQNQLKYKYTIRNYEKLDNKLQQGELYLPICTIQKVQSFKIENLCKAQIFFNISEQNEKTCHLHKHSVVPSFFQSHILKYDL